MIVAKSFLVSKVHNNKKKTKQTGKGKPLRKTQIKNAEL